MNTPLEKLVNNFSQVGTVKWVGLRPNMKSNLISIKKITLDPSTGIDGDHYSGRTAKKYCCLWP